MKDKIARLAYVRKVEAEYKAEIAQAQAELEVTDIWQYLERQRKYLKTAQADVADAEVAARKEAMRIFTKTDDRTPHPAVKIKDFTALDYDDGDAIEYAREHLPQALKLIKKIFEAAAKVVKLDFVTIWKEPRATIARDLSEYLECRSS